MNKKETFISDRLRNGQIVQLAIRLFSLKGGDPAAPSDTATLLRLHPSYQTCLRRLLLTLGHRLRAFSTPMV